MSWDNNVQNSDKGSESSSNSSSQISVGSKGSKQNNVKHRHSVLVTGTKDQSNVQLQRFLKDVDD